MTVLDERGQIPLSYERPQQLQLCAEDPTSSLFALSGGLKMPRKQKIFRDSVKPNVSL